MAIGVLILGILAFAVFFVGAPTVVFYIVVIIALVFGFFFVRALSKSNRPPPPKVQAPVKKPVTRYS